MSVMEMLHWGEAPGISDHYEAIFASKAERRLASALSLVKSADPDSFCLIRDITLEMPASHLVRIAYAPELEYRLQLVVDRRETEQTIAAFLLHSLRAELLLADRSLPLTGDGVWTALGDENFRAPSIPDSSNPEWPFVRSVTMAQDESTGARSGIPIDFLSPYNRGDFDVRFPAHENLTDFERRSVRDNVLAALRVVELGGLAVNRFVCFFTRVIVAAKWPTLGDKFGSFSSSWFPGRTVLVNAQSSEMELFDRAAALVHEAIHSLIDASELEGQMLVRDRGEVERVTSPWTGASLPLQSLIDAYFVWYGLLWFWRRVNVEDRSYGTVCAQRITQCEKGFRVGFATVVGDQIINVHPFAESVIDALRSDVLGTG